MARFTAEDTNISVQQPALDFNRPQTDIIKPIVAGIGAIAKAFGTQATSPEEVTQGVAEAYSRQLDLLEESGQLDNNTIARLNREAMLGLNSQLTKLKADSKVINSNQNVLKEIFEKDSRFATVNRGRSVIQQDRDGSYKVLVNDAEEARNFAAAEALSSLDPLEYNQVMQMPADRQKKYIDSKADQYFYSEQMKIKTAYIEHQMKLFQFNELEAKPRRERGYTSLVGNLAGMVLVERSRILDSTLTPDEKETQIKRLLSMEGLLRIQPGLPQMMGTLGKDFQKDLLPSVEGLALSKTDIIALTTDIDKMDMETLTYKSMLERDAAKAVAGIPISQRSQTAIMGSMKDAALSWELFQNIAGKGSADVEVMKFLMDSDTTKREMGHTLGSFFDLTAPNSAENRAKVVDQINSAMFLLSDPENMHKSPMSVELLDSTLSLIQKTQGWEDIPQEKRDMLTTNMNMLLDYLAQGDPNARAIHEKYLKKKQEAFGFDLPFFGKSKPKTLSEE